MFLKCCQTSNQIAIGLPPGATSYIYLLQSAANLKRLGTTGLVDVAYVCSWTDNVM